MFDDPGDQQPSLLPETAEEEIASDRRRRKGHGWGKLPEHLPREEVLVDVPGDFEVQSED